MSLVRFRLWAFYLPIIRYGRVAQVVEHLTFNQVVRGSNPRTLIVTLGNKIIPGVFFVQIQRFGTKEIFNKNFDKMGQKCFLSCYIYEYSKKGGLLSWILRKFTTTIRIRSID